jgi:hypothetical protein
MAKALRAGFQRFIQRSWAGAGGVERPDDEVEAFHRCLLVGEVASVPRRRRKLALSDSMAIVE